VALALEDIHHQTKEDLYKKIHELEHKVEILKKQKHVLRDNLRRKDVGFVVIY
jgi:phage shock protein A